MNSHTMLVNGILSSLADASVKALVLAALAFLVLRFLRVRDAALRHASWTAVLMGMLALPLLGPCLPKFTLDYPSGSKAGAVADPVSPAPLGGGPGSLQGPPTEAVHLGPTGVPSNTSPLILPAMADRTWAPTWPAVLISVYLTGASLMLGRLALGLYGCRRLMRRCRPLDGITLGSRCPRELVGWLEDERVVVGSSSSLRVPLALGWFRPRILLPEWWQEWSQAELGAVLAHELGHLERRDTLTTLAGAVNQCLYWFHPLAWILPRTLSALSERACDDRAIGLTGRRSQYAQHLLKVAQSLVGSSGRVEFGTLPMAGTSDIAGRIDAILDNKRALTRPLTRRGRWTLAAVAALLVSVVAMFSGLKARTDAWSLGFGGPDDGSVIRVEGRVIDLEGRPVNGATIAIKYVQSPPNGDLDAWIDEVKRLGKQPFGLGTMASASGRSEFSATTGRDGRFRIDGVPRDGIATASISGPGIETSQVYILTREAPTIRIKDPMMADGPAIVYYGTRFEHAAVAARPIVGTIRDKDSGLPIAGVRITGMPNIPSSMVPTPGVEATSDARGRYEVRGLSPTLGFKLFTEAPAGQPYVNCGFISPKAEPGPGPFVFDLALKRGVLVRGRLTNKVTGEALRGAVCYYAFADNPHLGDYPNFKRDSQVTRIMIPGSDGRFAIPALPGRGLISARAPEEGYLHGQGAKAIKGYLKEMRAFATYPFYCPTTDQHVFAEINPGPGQDEIEIDLRVDPGRTVEGRIVGPDGRAVEGPLEIRTLDVFQGPSLSSTTSGRFQVRGLPSGPYRLDFFQRAHKLAGSLMLTPDAPDNPTVQLQPWGTVTGRVVDEEGKPRTDVEIFSTVREQADPARGDLDGKPTVDRDGRFRIEGLVPGVRYDALGHAGRLTGPILQGVSVGPGETRDLGNITLSDKPLHDEP